MYEETNFAVFPIRHSCVVSWCQIILFTLEVDEAFEGNDAIKNKKPTMVVGLEQGANNQI